MPKRRKAVLGGSKCPEFLLRPSESPDLTQIGVTDVSVMSHDSIFYRSDPSPGSGACVVPRCDHCLRTRCACAVSHQVDRRDGEHRPILRKTSIRNA